MADRTIPQLYTDNPITIGAGVKIPASDAVDVAGAIDADVLLTTAAGEINALTAKSPAVGADKIVIEDSAASWAKKSVLISAVNGCAMACSTARTNFTPTGSTIDGHFAGIDTKLAGGVNSFVAVNGSGDATVPNDLDVTTDFRVNTNKFTVAGATGNTLAAGTLDVTGNFAVNANKATISASDGSFNINSGKLTVNGTSGNTLVAGTLDVTGNFALNTNKLTAAAADGSLSLNAGTVTLNGTTGNLVSPNLNFDGVLSAGTGDETSYSLTPTVNKLTSGDYTALSVNVTETSAPGTANKLASFGVGGTPVAVLYSSGILTTTAAGTSATPALAVRDAATGVYSPAANQVALVANAESVIVDNDDATPSLRPHADSTWDLGESSFYWKNGYFDGLTVNTDGITSQGNVTLQNSGKISLTGALEWLYAADAVAGTTDTLEAVADKGKRFDYQSSSATTVTIDQAASGVQTGAKVELVHSGSGALTFSAGTATVRTPPGRAARAAGQYSVVHATYNTNSEVYLEGDLARNVRAAGTSTFSINGSDYDAIVNWTGTSTGVAGTIDQGTPGQVTTLVLTGTAGTITLTAGSGVTLEAEEGKTLTTNAPGASTAVTVSLLYLSATHVVATGGLA